MMRNYNGLLPGLWRRIGPGIWLVIAAMGVTVVALVGLTRADPQHTPGNEVLMSVEEFRPLQAHKSVLVVDVRDAGSFANGHIPGAIHVAVRDIQAQLRALRKASKGRVIVTYCSCPTESSSLRAAKQLAGAGLTAKALVGGFPRWVESGGAIEKGTGVDLWKTPAPGNAQSLEFSTDRHPSPLVRDVDLSQQRRFGRKERAVLSV